MAKDPEVQAHQEWIGYVQPVGLVVSIPALLGANAYINRNFAPLHRQFLNALPSNGDGQPVPEIHDFPEFAHDLFGWGTEDLYGAPGAPAIPESLEAPLPEYNETLRPSFALHEFQPKDSEHEWILLINVIPTGAEFDAVAEVDTHWWQATPQARFERLLRETRVPAGLLVNGREIRLVFAPKGETSGYMTFKLSEMSQVAGRPMLAALVMLLSSDRLYGMAENQRLPAILENSRKYQNMVSTQLAGQVLEALYELLRGFQAADDQLHGELLREVLKRDPDHVYAGLLTTLLRLVFVLFAEDRGLLSTDPIYSNFYSVSGLYDRLRADAGRYPDTMDQRYGAWAQLLALFRLIYQGGSHAGMHIPAREGYLFDPDRYLFLEGRSQRNDLPSIPRVSDGVLFRVLSKLLLLDGERLSYRTLAVEQIGSVYQAIMGFELHVAGGQSIAIKPANKNGAPATINLEELFLVAPDKRLKWLADNSDQKLTGQAADALKSASSIEDLLAALERKIARAVTPNLVPKGAMIFQPSGERRRSGSHYTPSSLTGPIVEAALQPVLKQLGDNPSPDQILQLKVCDPAMGSAAFLVEACRQLGDALVKAWHVHNQVPVIPRDEDEVLYARRQIAQRCLYGVDKNPLAADLAKLSLWLATLAKDHPFTFLNHSLRAGDSLVGLTRRQIAAFHWLPSIQKSFLEEQIRKRIDRVSEVRKRILAAADDTPYSVLQARLDEADGALIWVRLAGDAAVAAFFSSDKPKAREEARTRLEGQLEVALKNPLNIELVKPIEAAVIALHKAPNGVTPFHWEIEFPEVFTVDTKGSVTGGFDVIVGNPPFAGGKRISGNFGKRYSYWIQQINPSTNGNVDLVAHFFRRAFALLRPRGTFGLVATNTIAQGDTRRGGLRWIGLNGGNIVFAKRRLPWPGEAAVIVSVIIVQNGEYSGVHLLNGAPVPFITAFLLPIGSHNDPVPLLSNRGRAFNGCDIQGQGFLFDDEDAAANSVSLMNELVARDQKNLDRILPFFGGEDINNRFNSDPKRWIICFGNLTEHEAMEWPELFEICRKQVKEERENKSKDLAEWPFWQFWRYRNEFWDASRGFDEVLAVSQTGSTLAFDFVGLPAIYGNTVVLFASKSRAVFAVMQSQVHRIWVTVFSSTMKDDLRYNPHDCFDTFPFPTDFEKLPTLDRAGREYCQFRAAWMVKNYEGLTATYNRFHNPEEENPDIVRLRELHDAMDRAVLEAYGWSDINPKCEFLLDYEEEHDGEEDIPRRRRKPWRYRWPDEIRDEVLARLLELNRRRALEEGQLPLDTPTFGQPAQEEPKKKGRKKKAVTAQSETLAGGLFSTEKGEA